MARRGISPWDPTKRARLVYLDQPLYASCTFNDAALTSPQVLLFKSQRNVAEPTNGATAIGAANQTYLNTNMDSPGILPNPRLFVVTGFAAVFRQVIGALEDVAPLGTPPGDQFTTAEPAGILTNDTFVAIRRLLFGQTTAGVNGGAWFKFMIGPKPYLEMPLYQIPAPYGVGGVSFMQQIGVVAPGGGNPAAYAPQLRGRIYSIDDLQVLIPSQQEFWAEINHDTTLPTLTAELRLWIIIFGVLGRESG